MTTNILVLVRLVQMVCMVSPVIDALCRPQIPENVEYGLYNSISDANFRSLRPSARVDQRTKIQLLNGDHIWILSDI